MARNGSGTYSAPSNSWNPAVTGVTATVSDWQALLDDMVAALTQSVSKDGQTTMTNSLPMGGNKLTGLGAPTGTGQALRWEQMIKGDDIVSADSISIPTEGSCFDVAGTTTITSIADTFIGKVAYLRFTDSLTITHSDSLVLPGGEDITTQENDVAVFINIAAGIWQCVTYPPSSGSNSNGNWIRFQDGTQICWIENSVNWSIGTAYGSLYIGTIGWTYPAAFVSTPSVSLHAKWSTSSSWVGGVTPGLTSVAANLMDIASRSSASSIFSGIAIGMWK